jgi:ketosteroid isomerase-like protein
MKIRHIGSFAGFTIIGLGAIYGAVASASPTDDVRCREIAFSLSAEHGDAKAFTAFIDPDARFVGNSVAHGIEQISEAWKVFFADDGPSIKWRPRFVEVLEDGGLALTRGPYRMISIGEDGNPVERWGTFNSVWRLHDDGEWRVVFDAGSSSSAEPSEEEKALIESNECAAAEKSAD